MARRLGLVLNSQLVPLMVARVRASGAPVTPLLRRFALPDDAGSRPELKLPLRDFHAFCEAVSEALADPFLGVNLATSLPRGAYGLIEFITQSSATVRDALLSLNRYSAVLNEIVEFSLEEHRGEAIFRHRIPSEPVCTGTHANEFMLVYAVRQLQDRAGKPFSPRRAWFAHPREGDWSPLAQALGTERIEFGRGENGFLFDAELLDLPVVGAEPALHAFLTEQAQRKLEALGVGAPFPARVRAQVEGALANGNPSTEAIARGLHMSGRTMQRKLDEAGLTFQELLDDVRRTRATLYLEDPRMGLSEIAFRLGYADVRSFARAFKRWTGVAPRGGDRPLTQVNRAAGRSRR